MEQRQLSHKLIWGTTAVLSNLNIKVWVSLLQMPSTVPTTLDQRSLPTKLVCTCIYFFNSKHRKYIIQRGKGQGHMLVSKAIKIYAYSKCVKDKLFWAVSEEQLEDVL